MQIKRFHTILHMCRLRFSVTIETITTMKKVASRRQRMYLASALPPSMKRTRLFVLRSSDDSSGRGQILPTHRTLQERVSSEDCLT